ncbi:nitrite/sulfite reductase [Rarobacter faecitabidus]|uniref:assimilatory sulfite reductase (ferredoxin) n=1 Tax=Rarobacter faecitabidus TaxID=13243 RepID=A0A542ZXI0_RARFA|nr:nitrite/sulfite reductase [Rarobacter faecitabidus]TQL65009.1 sulfite reductase (ferredoxin) [Rarobacter faecitabidus]
MDSIDSDTTADGAAAESGQRQRAATSTRATQLADAPGAATRRPATAAAGDRPARPARAARPNGQWKVDGKEPLNVNETLKQKDDGLNVRQRIESIYALGGFDSIPKEDLHGRFRWWGLYTQRKPGIDGGRTAQLETEEIEDSYFMLRVRVDGGALTAEQLRVIAGISRDFGRDTADITDRHNIQFHWIDVVDMPEIWRRLESVGLQTTEACGDVPRVILGSPVAGIAKDEVIDPTEIIDEIVRRYVGDPSFSNLPRKYKTAITGHPSLDVVPEINDFSLVPVVHPELGIGFDLWVGGGLSTSAHLAQRLGTFLAPERVPEVWVAVTSIFRDYGYRRLRNRARLKYLMADWGAEKFRQVLQDEYLGYELPDGPPPPQPTRSGDHVGVHEQKDGNFYIGAAPHVGRTSGSALLGVAELAESVGSNRIRLTPYQKLLVLDVPGDDVERVVEGLRELGFEARPGSFRRSTMACTGIEYCKLAIVETKATATTAINQLEERLGSYADEHKLLPITLNVNGCPNSCARIQTADIGLKGQLVLDDDGEQVPGFQVHLGGGLVSEQRAEAGVGRTVRGLKVTADGIADYVERVTRRYVDGRSADETFAAWALRAEDDDLR